MNASISLDLRKHRIRFHSQTLKALGNPEYIHVLINPSIRSIIVTPCSEYGKDSLKIFYRYSEGEIYSNKLISLIAKLNHDICEAATYRISGNIPEDSQIALFDLNIVSKVTEPTGKMEKSYE